MNDNIIVIDSSLSSKESLKLVLAAMEEKPSRDLFIINKSDDNIIENIKLELQKPPMRKNSIFGLGLMAMALGTYPMGLDSRSLSNNFKGIQLSDAEKQKLAVRDAKILENNWKQSAHKRNKKNKK